MSASERKIAQLEDEIVKLRAQLVKVSGGAESLEFESGVNKQLDGFITLRWGAEVAQLSVAAAREHALDMLEAANAAEMDASLLRGVRELDMSDEIGFGLLRLIREHRTGDPSRSA